MLCFFVSLLTFFHSPSHQTISIILSQIRWLDNVYDSDFLTKKIFEVFEVCPLEIQKDIITALPDIVNDSSHPEIAEDLQLQLRNNSEGLTSTLIFALGQLNIPIGQKEKILDEAIELLDILRFQELPHVIKFIITAATKSSITKVIQEIRTVFKNLGRLSGKDDGDDVIIIIEAFKDAIKYQKDFGPFYLKLIEKVLMPSFPIQLIHSNL